MKPRSGGLREKEERTAKIKIVAQDDKWALNEFSSSLFSWKLEDGIREIAGQPR